MALYQTVAGNNVVVLDANQYFSLLTGAMTDQPVTFSDGLTVKTQTGLNVPPLSIVNTLAGGTTWLVGPGDNGLRPNELFLGRSVGGSVAGLSGSAFEVLLSLFNDGSTRKIQFLSPSGTPELAFNVGAALLTVDANGQNTGTVGTGTIIFGSTGSGEGIGSKRNAGGNQNGLDFYTGSTARLSISTAGAVSIGGFRVPFVDRGTTSSQSFPDASTTSVSVTFAAPFTATPVALACMNLAAVASNQEFVAVRSVTSTGMTVDWSNHSGGATTGQINWIAVGV